MIYLWLLIELLVLKATLEAITGEDFVVLLIPVCVIGAYFIYGRSGHGNGGNRNEKG